MGRLVVYTGAGISAESGLATFRGSQGLWNGHSIDEVCNISTWKANFEAVHAFYNSLRTDLAQVEPNAAHRAVGLWSRRYRTLNLTTNIDDLLERGGCSDVVHLHGTLAAMQCTACGQSWAIGHEAWQPGSRCRGGRRQCASIRGVKPDVVFYGEYNAARYAHLSRALRELERDDVFLVVGSSCAVPPIAQYLRGLPGHHILVNPHPLQGGGEEVFEHVVRAQAGHSVDEVDALLVSYLGQGAQGDDGTRHEV